MSGAPPRTAGASLVLSAAGLRDLAAVRGFVGDACGAEGADASTARALVLAADEVCANVLQHGYGARGEAGGGPLAVHVARDADRLVVHVADEAPHFDPGTVAPPCLDAPAETRPAGGLGWHLVRQAVDDVRWEPLAPNGNRVTLVKRLAAGGGARHPAPGHENDRPAARGARRGPER